MTTDAEIQHGLDQYQNRKKRTGLFNWSEGPQAFLVSSQAAQRNEASWPDLQFTTYVSPVVNSSLPPAFHIIVTLGRHASLGRLVFNTTALRNGDWSDDTKLVNIDFNFFSTPGDIAAIIEGEEDKDWNYVVRLI